MSRCIPVDAAERCAPSSLIVAAVLALAMVLALGLGGCAASPPMRYHALAAVGAQGKLAYEGLPIEVGAVQVPPALARQELVREIGGGRLQIRESDHWAAPLGRLARQALAEDFEARLPPGKVVFPGAAWPAAGAVLTVDILSYTVRDGTATMLLSWNLRPTAVSGEASPTAVAPPRGAQLRLTTSADDGTDATALAWNQLLGQLADQVAAELARSPLR